MFNQSYTMKLFLYTLSVAILIALTTHNPLWLVGMTLFYLPYYLWEQGRFWYGFWVFWIVVVVDVLLGL